MTIYEKRLEADIVELVSALKFAAELVGHPDDVASKYFASVLAKYTFKPVDMTPEDIELKNLWKPVDMTEEDKQYADSEEAAQRKRDAKEGFDE